MSIGSILKARAKNKMIGSAVAKTGNKSLVIANRLRVKANRAKMLGKRMTNKFRRPRASRAAAGEGLTKMSDVFKRGASKAKKKISYAEQVKNANKMQIKKIEEARRITENAPKKVKVKLRTRIAKRIKENSNKIFKRIMGNARLTDAEKTNRIKLLDFVHASVEEGVGKKVMENQMIERRYPPKIRSRALGYYKEVLEGA